MRTNTIQAELQPSLPCDRLALPSLLQIAHRAVPQIVDGAVLPVFLFVTVDRFAGLFLAMVAGLGWSAFAIVRRVARSRRVPAMVILGTATLCVRATLALTTGSAFLYFLQPTVGTAVIGLAFLVSVPVGRPLSGRFAGDFLTLPRELLGDPRVQRFFRWNSVMWAFVGLLNAAIAYWLLVTLATATFAVTQTAIFLTVTVLAVGISILWFRRSMGRYTLITVGV